MEVLRRAPCQRSYTVINMSSNVTHIHPPTIIGVQNFSSSSAPYHTLFVFLIPLLVRVIEINNVQDKNKSLIETHSMSMCLFLVALLIYAFAYICCHEIKTSNLQGNCCDLRISLLSLIGLLCHTHMDISVSLYGLLFFFLLLITRGLIRRFGNFGIDLEEATNNCCQCRLV